MSLSSLPLSYCTNVHPGRTVAEVEAGLDRYTVPVGKKFARPLCAGLWLADPVVRELLSKPGGIVEFRESLQRRGLSCHTLNAFPFGDFHSPRVKEKVYLPDWSEPARLKYTQQCATVLAALLPPGVEGSISTLPLGFKGFDHSPDFVDRCADQLITCARSLDDLHLQTGRLIRMGIEPEPFCILETTDETVRFFARLRDRAARAGAMEAVQSHIGVCFDVCHQAVEFEDVAASIRSLDHAEIRINKVHISCAIQIDHPAHNEPARSALSRYVEPRYLHQTLARLGDGTMVRQIDLTDAFAKSPGDEFLSAPAWRVHFHVPVDVEILGPLRTTRSALLEALPAIAALNYAPHLEVETYTWEVLPGSAGVDLVDGLSRELIATDLLLKNVARQAGQA
jgi:sugar phosphate isomerase/epimerase